MLFDQFESFTTLLPDIKLSNPAPSWDKHNSDNLDPSSPNLTEKF